MTFAPQGIKKLRHWFCDEYGGVENNLSTLIQQQVKRLLSCLYYLDEEISRIEQDIQNVSSDDDDCQRLKEIQALES